MASPPAKITGDSVEHRSYHLPHRGRVRVVGKIGPFVDQGPSLTNRSQVSVVKADGDHALISFTDHSASRNESYKLDWCYEQDEGIDQIFSKEIKPLLDGVLRGSNACVLGYGARRSGKTHAIQGSEENPGLAPMAAFELLTLIEGSRGGSVSISCYEVNQDRIYDVLEPKEQEVLVLEDAGRRIQLKGLSRVPVKSVSDFKRLYFNRHYSDSQLRTHKGLIIYVATANNETNTNYLGKINFIDLAGYEDVKRISDPKRHLSESAKINKSLFQLLNVVYALNANETHVPYRESKLTRLMQEFMCKSSGAVLLTCLNPVSCLDTVHVVSMASRSCHVVNQYRYDSSRKHKSSLCQGLPGSPSAGRTGSINSSTKKNENIHFGSKEKRGNKASLMTKKGIGFTPAAHGSSARKVRHFQPASVENNAKDMPQRKLFDAASHITGSIQDKVLIISEAVEHSSREEVECISQVVEHSSSDEDVVPATEPRGIQTINETAISDPRDDLKKDSSNIGETSPPLSERIREISNSLRLLSCQPLAVNTPQPDALFTKGVNVDHMDPKTPVPFNLNLDENSTFGNTFTPQDRLRTRSTGLKKSLVHECLAFLNSANKEELKSLKGIGEKRASYIVELRETETEPFKDVDDIRALGLSSRQVEDMITSVLGAI